MRKVLNMSCLAPQKAMVLCGIMLVATSVCRAETYYLQGSGSTSSLTSHEVWATSAGVACSEITSSDSFVCEGRYIILRIDAKTGGTFAGGSLAIGTADGAGAGVISQKTGAVLTFPDYGTVDCGGLVLKNGVLATGEAGGEGRHDILGGTITVESTSDEPFMIVDYRGYNPKKDKKFATIEINADFRGVAGTAIEFGSVFQGNVDTLANDRKSTSTNTTLLLTGTFDKFYGTLAVTNKVQQADVTSLGVLNTYGSRLKLDTASAFSGKLLVNGGNVLECTTAGQVYEIGGLEMRPGSVLLLNGSTEFDSRKVPISTACASLQVTGACRVAGPVMVALPGCTVLPDGMTNRIEILTAASSAELDPEDFVLAGCGTSNLETGRLVPSRFVVESGADGSKTLFCEFEPYAILTASDSTARTSGDYPSAITNGASWSSGVAQASNVNYVVVKLNGTAMSLRSLRVNENGTNTCVFSGKRLIIAESGKLYTDCNVFKSEWNPLRILDGGRIVSMQYGNVKFIGGLELYRGLAWMYMYTSTLDVDALTGEGVLQAGGGQDANRRTNFRGSYYFRNTEEFMGDFMMQQSDPPRATMYQSLYVCGNALGGPLAEFNPAALCLTDESALTVDPASPTQRLENVVNRGVLVDGSGRVRLEEEHERLRIDWPLSMDGELWKEGAGTLVLGGECLFGSAGAADPSEDTVANVLLKQGVLAVASASALDGCHIAISNGTKIAVVYESGNNALVKYGLRNVKTEDPFELCNVDGGQLPLAIDFSGWGGAMPDALEVGLVTVTNQEDVVAAVRSIMPETIEMLGTRPFYKAKRSEAANADDNTFTFKAILTKVGFTAVIR